MYTPELKGHGCCANIFPKGAILKDGCRSNTMVHKEASAGIGYFCVTPRLVIIFCFHTLRSRRKKGIIFICFGSKSFNNSCFSKLIYGAKYQMQLKMKHTETTGKFKESLKTITPGFVNKFLVFYDSSISFHIFYLVSIGPF